MLILIYYYLLVYISRLNLNRLIYRIIMTGRATPHIGQEQDVRERGA
jgi:hypothetical protein